MPEKFAIFCAVADGAAPPRVAAALTRHGAEVCVVAPPDSYIALTRYKTADILMPLAELERKLPAIVRTLADGFGAAAILAGDQSAFTLLARLTAHLDSIDVAPSVRALLARSMPNTADSALLACDSAFLLAQAGKPLPPPASLESPSFDAALAFAKNVGFPVLLKRNGYAGGAGVVLCESEAELRAALANGKANARDPKFLVQQHLPGPVYGVAISGVSGKAAAAFSFVKHQTAGPLGVACVLKHDRREAMLDHARGLYEAYGMNGYAGIDYILDAAGEAHLLEINPCIVPKSHFAECFGVDLTAAMLAQLRGAAVPQPQAPAHQFVALFPNEWARDPASAYLTSAFHDVPWDDPAVLAAIVRDFAERRRATGVLNSRG